MAGLFDTFSIAKRGLSVQQGNINTTSHNIANAQTEGYSRQRNTVQTTRPFGGNGRFDTCSVGQIGTGAEITQITRIRDTFLDYKVRTVITRSGTSDTKNQYLTEVEDILNETSDSGIQSALTNFFTNYQNLANDSTKESNRTIVMQKAEALAEIINKKYNEIENEKKDAQTQLKDYTRDINKILDGISQLNKQIVSVSSMGMTPNDLMDSRDLLIDQLSSKFGVKVTRKPEESMDISVPDRSDIANVINSDAEDNNYTRFSCVESVDYAETGKDASGNITYDKTKLVVKYSAYGNEKSPKTITISGTEDEMSQLKNDLTEDRILVADKDGNVVKSTVTKVAADPSASIGVVSNTIGNDGTGTIVEVRMVDGVKTQITTVKSAITSYDDMKPEIFNGLTEGQVAGCQKVEDDIQGYIDKLDKFTAAFAYSVNAIQTGDRGIAGDAGIIDKDGNKIAAELIFVVRNDDGTISNSDAGISAKNIAINTAIQKDLSKLNCGQYSVDDYSGVKDGTRALAIADLNKLKIDMADLTDEDISDREKFFSKTALQFDSNNLNLTTTKDGSKLTDYYSSLVSNVETDNEKAVKDVNDNQTELKALTNDRLSVSGVSMDEEMTGLIQYQHAYQANAKVINTVDQLLDVVINGLIAR